MAQDEFNTHNQVILMYHSVTSDEHKHVQGSFPISLDRFKYQVNAFLERGYRVGRLSDLHVNKHDHKNKYLYITADDGTTDWTRNALPWCEQEEIYTHTAIITGPWGSEPIYPLAHITQILLTSRSEAELDDMCSQIKLKYLACDELAYVNRVYAYEQQEYRRVIKGAFNLILEECQVYELIGDLSPIEREALRYRFEQPEFYLSLQYADVGSHSVSHRALGLDTDDYIENEIIRCHRELEANGIMPSKFFTSPMTPKHGATLRDLVGPLREMGYEGILDHGGLWDQQDFIIKRLDAKKAESFLGIDDYEE